MKVRLTTLIIGLFILSICFVLWFDAVLGLAYAFSISPLILFVLLVKSRKPFVFTPVIGAVLSFYVFYFIRPLMIVPYPEFFGYSTLGVPNSSTLIEALILQGLFSLAFLSGLFFALHIIGSKLRAPLPLQYSSVIDRLGESFLLVIVLISLLWLFLALFLGAGQKLSKSSMDYFALILPITLLIPSALAYLSRKVKKRITFVEFFLVLFVIFINVLSILLTGSKAGVFLLILYVFLYLMYLNRDFKVRVVKALFITQLVIISILVTVVLANMIKYSNASTYSSMEILRNTLGRGDLWLFMLDRISFRLNGYDGSVAVLMHHPLEFESVANWLNMIYNGIAQLLPGISGNSYSVGKAVGLAFGGKSVDEAHAGALGLIGIVYFMHGYIGGALVCFLLGSWFGVLFRIIARVTIKTIPERITAFLVLSYLLAFWVSSGNFDKLVQVLGISIIHMTFYYFVLVFILKFLKNRSTSSRYSLQVGKGKG